ncbi:MAG: UDP-N-acetylmuramoylalanine--D-glutamate ligase [Chlamydia sp. 32-24]|nr:MAG: UDP-N-acetylmuramoylalanine--D-glutamate ligase [Chlamydia sp. 32-24]
MILADHILIVGLGLTGQSIANFLLKNGKKVFAIDANLENLLTKKEVQELVNYGLKVFSDDTFHLWHLIEVAVLSPGISPNNKIYKELLKLNIPVLSDIEIALNNYYGKCIGITGTNGKTSTTLLVTHLLNEMGVTAAAVGNIGQPVINETKKLNPSKILVIELSSFQLEIMNKKSLDVGVILNITPDHLDRYATMENYTKAKLRIAHCIKDKGSLFLNSTINLKTDLSSAFHCHHFGYSNINEVYTDLDYIYVKNKKIALPKKYQKKKCHHIENIMAACAIISTLNLEIPLLEKGLESFTLPEHRIEWVRDVEGISYYNDSKATNIDAVLRAVENFKQPIRLIVGGVDKGFPYTDWIEAFKGKVVQIIAIGQAANKIKTSLEPYFKVDLALNLEEAVKYATRDAKNGDIVLLSPGCSSYDMFKDFADRGNEFKRIVNCIDKVLTHINN